MAEDAADIAEDAAAFVVLASETALETEAAYWFALVTSPLSVYCSEMCQIFHLRWIWLDCMQHKQMW